MEGIASNTEKRMFYISSEVDNESMGAICFNLLFLLKEDDNNEKEKRDFTREPIHIYINSFGGSIYDMWGLIDIITNSKTPIYTYCTGYAMSAAFIIFLAGHKRFCYRHSTFMYHQSYFCIQGKYKDLVETREEQDHLQKTIEEYVVERTKLSKEKIDEIRDKKVDMYIHCDKAVEYGIVDEIIGSSN